MNGKALFLTILGLGAGLFVMADLLTGGYNAIGRLFFYFAIGSVCTGFLAPRVSVFLIVICSGYLDFFKRLMVVYGNPSPLDVAFIQGIPLGLLGGAVAGTFVNLLLTRRQFLKEYWVALILAFLFLGFSMVSFLAGSGGGLRGLGQVFNQAFYPAIIFLIAVHFRTPEQLRRLFNFVFVTFIPVAAYMFRHRYLGLADFEYDYLMTGLSQEARILYEQEALRGFSTMNGAAVVSTMLSNLVLLCFVPLRPNNAKPAPPVRLGKMLLALIFIPAAYFTASRNGWVTGVAGILLFIAYQRRWSTLLAYLGGLSAFILVVAVSPYLLKNHILNDWQEVLDEEVADPSDAYANRAVTLGTFNARLVGWSNLTQEPEIWTPFGFAAAGKDKGGTAGYSDLRWGHDITTSMLIEYGYVPCFLAFCAGCWFLIIMHRFLLSLPRGSLEKKLCLLALSRAIAILIGGLANGAQLRVFPLNLYFYMFLAMVIGVYFDYRQKVKARRLEMQEEAMAALPTALGGGRVQPAR